MTLKELSEHPELASEEDRKAIEMFMSRMQEMRQNMKYSTDGITKDSGRTKEEIAQAYYVETMLMAAILEAFVTKPEQKYKDINKFVFNYTDKAFLWDVPITDCFRCISKLCAIGLLEMNDEDKNNPSFVITKDGYDALRQQTYANLAQAALFNLKTQQLSDHALILSKRSVRQNWLMLIVAIASTIAAFISVFIALGSR